MKLNITNDLVLGLAVGFILAQVWKKTPAGGGLTINAGSSGSSQGITIPSIKPPQSSDPYAGSAGYVCKPRCV